jgi:hypothetical protein
MEFSLLFSPQTKQTKYQSEVKECYEPRLVVQDGSIENMMLMLPQGSHVEVICVWIPNSIEILKLESFSRSRKLLFIGF